MLLLSMQPYLGMDVVSHTTFMQSWLEEACSQEIGLQPRKKTRLSALLVLTLLLLYGLDTGSSVHLSHLGF